MTTFYLIRHGEVDYNRNDTMIFKGMGRNFSPLTYKGTQQISHISADIRLSSCKIIISSPYTRAIQSASILSRKLQLDLIVEPTLFEWVENKKFSSEVIDSDLALNEYNKYNGVYPKNELKDWEDNELLSNRILEVMERYLQYDKVIIVCHGILIHSLFPDKWLKHSEIIEYEYDYKPSERFAVYDVNGIKTGRTMIFGNRQEEHEYSMFVHIIVSNNQGKFLLQKRSMKKRFFPGVWDTTGGCVKHYEETIDAALRETEEETGLIFAKSQIKFVRRILNRNFVDVFFAQKNFNLADCILDENEVDELKLFEPEEMYELFLDKKNPPCDKEYLDTLREIITNIKT